MHVVNSTRTLVVLMAAVFAFGAMACASPSEPVEDEGQQQTEQPADQQAAAKAVTLYQYRFNPNTLTVPAGTTVVFTNKDPEKHNVTIPALNIDESIEPGGEFTHTFNTTGEFAVSNRLSATPMKMTLVVE